MNLPIISADQRLAEPRGVKGTIFGKSGIGKTSLLWTLDPDTTLFIDLEAGDLAIEGWSGDSVRPRTWAECRDFAVFIGGPNPALRDDQVYSEAHFAAVCERFGDPNWNGGDYYGGEPPLQGLAEALKVVTLHAQHPEWSNGVFGRAWADEAKDPAASFDHLYKIEAVLDAVGAARAKTSDANHFLYLAKANQLFYAGHGNSLYAGLLAIDSPVLIIHTDEDLIFPGDAVRETASIIKSDGTPVQVVELEGTRGHLDGVLSIAQAGKQIRAFLDK